MEQQRHSCWSLSQHRRHGKRESVKREETTRLPQVGPRNVVEHRDASQRDALFGP
jgi:hypothetical protein